MLNKTADPGVHFNTLPNWDASCCWPSYILDFSSYVLSDSLRPLLEPNGDDTEHKHLHVLSSMLEHEAYKMKPVSQGSSTIPFT